MKPKKKKKAKPTDFDRLAPPPTSSPTILPNKSTLELEVMFDTGDISNYKISPSLRQELLTRLTPSLDKPTPSFIGFTETARNNLVILNTNHIFSIEVVRS